MKGEKVTPDSLKRFLEKPVRILLNQGRRVCGILKGYDHQLNINLFDTVEERKVHGEYTTEEVGVVSIRGSSIIHVEVLEKADPPGNMEIITKTVTLPIVLSQDLNVTLSSSETNTASELDVSAMDITEFE